MFHVEHRTALPVRGAENDGLLSNVVAIGVTGGSIALRRWIILTLRGAGLKLFGCGPALLMLVLREKPLRRDE